MADFPGAGPVSPMTGQLSGVYFIRHIDVEQLRRGYATCLRIDISPLLEGIDQIALLHDLETGLSFFHPMPFGDEAFYNTLSKNVLNYHAADKQEYRIAKPYIPAGASVFEIGAGEGHFHDYLENARYCGLEFNQSAIDTAQARGINVRRQDVVELAAVEPETFDITCAFQVIEHVPDPLQLITAMARLTKPGGKIILSAPNADSYIVRCRELLNLPPHHYTWWEDRTWHWVAARLGLVDLTLHHSSMDEGAGQWAQMIAANGMARLLGVELDLVIDETPMRHRIDMLTASTAQIILNGLLHGNDLPALGHTTVAVFSKRPTDGPGGPTWHSA